MLNKEATGPADPFPGQKNEDVLNRVQEPINKVLQDLHDSWKKLADETHKNRMYWMERCAAAETVLKMFPVEQLYKDNQHVQTWLDLKARE